MSSFPKIAPSLLAGDFGRLADEARRAEAAGADWLHLDVMDGHFVPNLTMGPQAVSAVRQACGLYLDVHLMIYNPFDYIERFVQAGANSITIHFEATEDVEDTLAYIKRCNVAAGLAFCPETSASMIPGFLSQIDLLLLMTVSPGFGGQAFQDAILEKVRFARQLRNAQKNAGNFHNSGHSFLIQVDGGINDKTGPLCVQAGADVLVAGTYLFKAHDMATALSSLKSSPL